MASPKHFNLASGSAPYKNLYSNVSIVPAGASLAFISFQWAADPKTGELVAGTENDYGKQSAIIWANIMGILKELGVGLDAVVHRTVNFAEFVDDIGVDVVTAMMEVIPDEWKQYAMSSSLSFNRVSGFHKPGVVYTVDCVVAVPALK